MSYSVVMSSVNQAFKEIDRIDFVPANLKDKAYIDTPLPIGFGQTISQPSTVEFMLTQLNASSGNKVLDVGSGSGWTSALLSKIVGLNGKVFAVERIPELLEMGQKNCKKFNIKNVTFYKAGKIFGLPQFAPYDRILVSASANELPFELVSQLKIGGKMIIPVKNDILEVIRTSKTEYSFVSYPGFVFVPLIKY